MVRSIAFTRWLATCGYKWSRIGALFLVADLLRGRIVPRAAHRAPIRQERPRIAFRVPLEVHGGRGRAGDLAALLDEKAVPAQRVVLYHAEAASAFSDAARAALCDAEEPVEGVLLYSQRSAAIFLALYEALPPHPEARPTAYCLAPPIADTMREAGFAAQAPVTADSAALLDLLAI